MGQRPKELTPHESLHHYWGAELRAWRVARGLSLAELGTRLHCDPSYLAKIERADRPIPAALAETCDQVLETHGTLGRLHALAESTESRAATGGRTSAHVAGDAVHVANPAGNLADGAGFPAVADTGAEIVVPARTADGRVVFVSVPRRVFLQGLGSAAVGLTTIPATAHHITLPTDVNPVEHFQQLRHVLIENDNLFGPRQVIPVVREQIGIMQQLRSSWRGADQHELIRVQAQYSELCGWLYQDAGEYHLAESWVDHAFGLSQVTGDRNLTVFLLTCKAHLAGERRIAVDAIGAGEQALRISAPRSRIAVIAASRAGYGYALSGDQAATQRAHDRARELLGTVEDDPDSAYAPWLNEKWVALGEAQSLTALGDYRCAARSFQNVIGDLPGRYRRGRGVCLARAALAQAGDRQVEHAATLGLDALAIGAETRSARILTELAHLDDQLKPWNTVPAVADFRTAMKDTILHQARPALFLRGFVRAGPSGSAGG